MAYTQLGDNNGDQSGDLSNLKVVMMTEVLKYFMDTNVTKEMVTVKSIDSGKSADFPIVGNTSAVIKNNNAAELSVNTIKHTSRLISIEGLMVAHSYITDIDEASLHYSARATHTESIGRSLAKKYDIDIIEELISAGDIAGSTEAAAAGLKPFSDDIYTEAQEIADTDILDGSKIYGGLVACMTEFRDKDAVGEPAYLVRPAQYFAMLNNPANTGLTWVNDEYAQSGRVPMVLGSRVVYSPHFPAFSGGSGAAASGDVLGILFSKEAVGVVELMSTSVAADYVPTRVSWLVVGKLAKGNGILNHACAVSLKVA